MSCQKKKKKTNGTLTLANEENPSMLSTNSTNRQSESTSINDLTTCIRVAS